MENRKAIVLLSGGLDSATTLYYARARGYKCHCLIFDYGQRHKREVESAKKIARAAGCGYQVLKINLPGNTSSLINRKINIPKGIKVSRYQGIRQIPSTYVPARNIIFLSFALHCAESIGAHSIFIGANAIDYSGYPDCRPEFLEAFRQVVKTGTRAGLRINGKGLGLKVQAPLIKKRKKEIVELAKKLKVPIGLTWSCYKGKKAPCEACDSCVLRAKGFREAGVKDPVLR